jgi:hypothetical protein
MEVQMTITNTAGGKYTDNVPVEEESVVGWSFAFTDTDGSAVTPNTITWDLTDTSGTPINSRDNVSVSPDTSVTIVLEGDDLKLQDGESNEFTHRVLTVAYNYDSNTLGASVSTLKELTFYIQNMVGVPNT